MTDDKKVRATRPEVLAALTPERRLDLFFELSQKIVPLVSQTVENMHQIIAHLPRPDDKEMVEITKLYTKIITTVYGEKRDGVMLEGNKALTKTKAMLIAAHYVLSCMEKTMRMGMEELLDEEEHD